jgi:Protein of unknown function (DUF2281)
MTVKDLLLQEIDTTNETVIAQTLTYIQSLKQSLKQNSPIESPPTNQPKKYRQAGTLKGMFTMADDFDAPLDDLKDYM